MRDLNKIRMKAVRLEMQERLIDLAYCAGPIFVITGLIVISVKFWLWICGVIF